MSGPARGLQGGIGSRVRCGTRASRADRGVRPTSSVGFALTTCPTQMDSGTRRNENLSLRGHPHWAHPDDLSIGLQAAHVIVAGLALDRRRVLIAECQHAISAGGAGYVAVLH